MKFPVYLGLLHRSEQTLAGAYRQIASGHGAEPDIHFLCLSLAAQCDKHIGDLAPMIAKYGEADSDEEPERLHADTLSETRSGPLGMLRDLQDLYLLANLVDVTWMMVKQVAQGLRDDDLMSRSLRRGYCPPDKVDQDADEASCSTSPHRSEISNRIIDLCSLPESPIRPRYIVCKRLKSNTGDRRLASAIRREGKKVSSSIVTFA